MPSTGERKLTQEEVNKDLGGPVEYDAKVYTERTRRCAGSHPDTKDQDTSGKKEEVRIEKNNQNTKPWPGRLPQRALYPIDKEPARDQVADDRDAQEMDNSANDRVVLHVSRQCIQRTLGRREGKVGRVGGGSTLPHRVNPLTTYIL